MLLLITGSVFLLAGTTLYGLMHVAVSNYIPKMSGWGGSPGKLVDALDGIAGLAPYRLSIFFIVLGILIILISLAIEYRPYIEKIKQKDSEEGPREESL